jgi:integrase/recombinase XerD
MQTLRQRMADDMRVRNFSPKTVEAYLHYAGRFAAHFDRAPGRLGPEEVRAFQLHLFEAEKLAPSSVNVATCALRFLFRVTLGRAVAIDDLPLCRRRRKLPLVLSRADVRRLLDAAPEPRFRAMMMAAYGAGLRLGEVRTLRVEDVDSERMVIRVRSGKGGKDRLVMLSPVLLEELRAHWRREKPATYLFPTPGADRPIYDTALQRAVKRAAKAAGLSPEVSPHTLRHCFATHLLEDGVDIHVIQQLMGHKDIRTTMAYLRVSTRTISRTASPLDHPYGRADSEVE